MTKSRYVLGIDTSSRLGSIALAVDGKAVASEPLLPGGHSSGLSVAGEKLLAARGIGWKDLAGIAVSEGPGSFTGLRIGLAWAKGVSMGSGIHLSLISAHAANAHRHRTEGAYIATVLPGEPEQLQGAVWEGGESVTSVWGPESLHWLDMVVNIQSQLSIALVRRQLNGGTFPKDRLPYVVACPDMKQEWLDMFAALRGIASDSAPPVASAVAELGDAKLLAGESADVASSAPAYGRSPNARKPAT
jgi:tRNA threonylcarbamoyl adenosine modification protein YeaZ